MPQVFGNAARSTLAAGISNSDTTITLPTATGAVFPSANTGSDTPGNTSTGTWFRAVIDDGTNIEVVNVRTHLSTDIFGSVQRGQEGTTARAWPAGTPIGLRVTAADMMPRDVFLGRRSTNVTLSTVGWQKLVINSNDDSRGNMWNASATAIIIQRPGFYLMTLRVAVTVACSLSLAIYKGLMLSNNLGGSRSDDLATSEEGTVIVYANAIGTTYEPYVYANNAATQAIAGQTYFHVMGPL